MKGCVSYFEEMKGDGRKGLCLASDQMVLEASHMGTACSVLRILLARAQSSVSIFTVYFMHSHSKYTPCTLSLINSCVNSSAPPELKIT